jgi:hypothetical protein
VPKLSSRPIGENSPNLVTLIVASKWNAIQKNGLEKSGEDRLKLSFFASYFKGDQIGRIFAQWVIVYFGQIF